MYRPFMAVESQVQQLNRRGLQTDMRTPWILEREGYYSVVNGYKDPFLDKEAGKRTHEDRYLTGTSFNDLYALFVFDRNLRFLLFRMATLSEAILKTICSYEFTKENADEKKSLSEYRKLCGNRQSTRQSCITYSKVRENHLFKQKS